MFKKNISDGVGSRNRWNGTPLNPPLFWLDNIFNGGGGLYLFYIRKFSTVDKRKYGVVAEGQGRDWMCDGSSPGHAQFEKVIFKIRLNFV